MFQENSIDLQHLITLTMRKIWVVLGCTLLGAAAAFLISSQAIPIYSASVMLRVHSSTTNTSDYAAILASEMLAQNYTKLLNQRSILDKTIEQLGLDESPENLTERVKVEWISDTQLIRLTVNDTDPAQAALIANTIAETFIIQNQLIQESREQQFIEDMAESLGEAFALSAEIQQTEARINSLSTPTTVEEREQLDHLETNLLGYHGAYASLLQSYKQMWFSITQSKNNVTVVEAARPPVIPVWPRTMLNTILAATLGAMMGMGLTILLEYLNTTIRTSRDVSMKLGLNPLGIIGQLAKGNKELVVIDQPLSPVAEAFHKLSAYIFSPDGKGSCRTILVSSPCLGEGKSIVAANLAVATAQTGHNVILIDANLRHPRLNQIFNLKQSESGLGEILLKKELKGNVKTTNTHGLAFLGSEVTQSNPAPLFARMENLLRYLASEADVVLIDGPALLPVADAVILAKIVDDVLLVLKTGYTRQDTAREAIECLHQVGANVVGVVLNSGREKLDGYSLVLESSLGKQDAEVPLTSSTNGKNTKESRNAGIVKRKFNLTEQEREGLVQAYGQCKDANLKKRYQAIRLYGEGHSEKEIEQIAGCSCASLMEWYQAYRQDPLQNPVGEQAKDNRAKLTEFQIEDLQQRLYQCTPRELFGAEASTANGQFWTVKDLARIVREQYGVEYKSCTSYKRLLARCGFSYQNTEKVYKARNQAKVTEFGEQLEKN